MNNLLFIVVLLPFIMGPLCYFAGLKCEKLRTSLSVITIAAELVLAAILMASFLSGNEVVFLAEGFCSAVLHLKLDGFRAVHILLAAFMWTMTALNNLDYSVKVGDKKQGRFTLFNLLTFGATLGVFLSGNLMTTFIFFEIMSFTSYVWVLHDETEKSKKASETYLAVSVIGGMVMLMGMFLLYTSVGTLTIDTLPSVCYEFADKSKLYLAAALMLVGFGAKAGMYPLHIWMPTSYPAAPAPATALLSGILSKAGVYGVIIICSKIFFSDEQWGTALLILAIITAFWGGILGIFSNDFKKAIACSSMSQIGFILVGAAMISLLGDHALLAVRGTVLHMINHSLIKLVLFMLTGVVFMNLKDYNFNSVKGFGKGKPVFMVAFLAAALGVGGMPLFNGYVSKTLIHESVVEYAAHLAEHGHPHIWVTVIEWIFLISGGLTVCYMLKIFFALFIHGEKKTDSKYIKPVTAAAVLIPSAIMVAIGVIPNITADRIADLAMDIAMDPHHAGHAVHYFSLVNLKGGLTSIVFGILFYFIIVRKFMMKKIGKSDYEYIDRWPAHFELEGMVYRPLIEKFLPWLIGAVCTFLDRYVFTYGFKFIIFVIESFAKLASGITDFIINLLAKTVYRPLKEKKEGPKHHKVVAYALGKVADVITDETSHILHKPAKPHESYAKSLEHAEEESAVRRKMISASLSYGLLFSGLGLVIVLLYLLFAK